MPESLPTPSGKATESFWLDGGYDRDQVEACPKHPVHDWWVFRLADVMHPDWMRGRHDQDERMVVCRSCWVPRCGYTTEIDPCILPRHHREAHITQSGALEDMSSWPGSDKPLPPLDVIQATDDDGGH